MKKTKVELPPTAAMISKSNPTLQRLFSKAQQLIGLNHTLQQFLSNLPLQQHCQIVNLRDGCLVIAAENASWCTLLRYQCPTLLTQFREAGYIAVQSIICQVQTPSLNQTDATAKHSAPILTKKTADFLLDFAADISHVRLKNALEKLAGTLREKM